MARPEIQRKTRSWLVLPPGSSRFTLEGWKVHHLLLYLILVVGSLAMIFPFLWMVATSFKPPAEIYNLSLIPQEPTLDNYKTVLLKTFFLRWFFNSFLVAGCTTLSVLFFDSLVGYTLAKYDFPGRYAIFIAILSSLMIPTEMLVIPWYMMSTRLGWTNTYWGIMFPGVITAFGIFLMKQFFEGVPGDLLDAARVDGVSEFGVFWRIALPQVKPALAALAIFTFLGNWNAFLWPVIVIESPEMRTLPVGIALFSGEHSDAWELVMAAATLAIIPVLTVFAIFQKQIIKGIALTGLKG